MYIIADGLARLFAPVLSFTMDEVWRHIPGAREESVHIAVFPDSAELLTLIDAELTKRWDELMALRADVLAQIEPLRKTKQIGSSLQARVVVSASAKELPLLEKYSAQLPMLFIVSEVDVRPAPADADAHDEAHPRVRIERAGGVKCERCWRYVSTVSSDPEWAGLCDRCRDALAGPSGTPRARTTSAGAAMGARTGNNG
jgi:isoleucyl-tRNA synthetase